MTYKIIGGDKQEYGPSTADEVRAWIDEGRLSAESMARTEPEGFWKPLVSHPEFQEALKEQARKFGCHLPAASVSRPARPDPGAISVGDCLSKGMRSWSDPFLMTATLAVWTTGLLMQLLPLLGMIYWPARGVLYGGLFMVFIRRMRGEQPLIKEVFAGFGPPFTQLALAGIATSLLTWMGFMLCFVPGVFLIVSWVFVLPAIADKGLGFWAAMERSRRAVHGQFSKIFVLCLIAFLPSILITFFAEVRIAALVYEKVAPLIPPAGMPDFAMIFQELNRDSSQIGRTALVLLLISKWTILFNLPIGLSALACAYEQLIGKREADEKNP
jgi:uncharacterized membrane protein